MHSHRTRTLLGAALALTLLAGCGSLGSEGASTDPDSSASPDASSSPTAGDGIGDGTGVPMPEATGSFGEKPEFTWPTGEVSPDLQVQVLSKGEGPVVEPGSVVVANYYGAVWGKDEAFDNSYDRGAPSMFSLNQVVAGWRFGIPSHEVGSRLLLTIPSELGYDPDGNPNAGIEPGDPLVFVVDVVESVAPDAMGEAEAQVLVEDGDLPVGIDGPLGEPAYAVVEDGATEPTEPSVVQVSQGTGAAVELGQDIVVSFSMTPFDGTDAVATWEGDEDERVGAQIYPTGRGSSWDAVIGMEIGSRVLLLFPGVEDEPALAVVADIVAAS